MTYARNRSAGLMGLGASPVDDQDPVDVGSMARSSPILSTSSVIASDIMLKMAAVPRSQRLAKMVSILNSGQPGLGSSAKVDFMRRAATMGPRKKDQAMYDAIRAALADSLVKRTLKLARGTAGLGQTVAEVTGGTSQGVNDANALFCSYGAGIGAMVGGFASQFGSSGSTAGVTGSSAAGSIAGCGAGALLIQGRNAEAAARLAQSTAVQTLAMQQEQDARFMRYVLVGGGVLGVLGLGYAWMKK